MKKLPWLEIILVAIMVVMIFISVNALFGEQISDSISDYCTARELWCAPATPTPTITPTPTATATPVSTLPPTSSVTPTP